MRRDGSLFLESAKITKKADPKGRLHDV